MADQPASQGEEARIARRAAPAHAARRSRPRLWLAVIAATAGLAGLGASVSGLATGILPRHFSRAEQQKIMAWEIGRRWRAWPAGQIFPSSVTYTVPGRVLDSDDGLSLVAHRVGIAPQAPCAQAADRPAAGVLTRHGCVALLRATYADATGAFVTTIGIAVLGSPNGAAGALAALPASKTLSPGVLPVAFPGTVTAPFGGRSRQVSAGIAAGPYLIMFTAGYADGRPRLAVGDQYGRSELTSVAAGIAGQIASRIGASPALPHCPGTPGC